MKAIKKNKMKAQAVRYILLTAITALIIITYTGCGDEGPVSKSDFCLDTSCEIKIYDDMDKSEAEDILDEAFGLIRGYEKMLSKTISTSDVARINDAGGQWIEVSADTIDVIRMANLVAYESGGVFDVTIGKVTDLWDFKSEDPKVPEASSISEALTHVNYRKITTGGGKVLVSDAQAQIDLGGVAKGYIADRVCEFLEEKGVTSAVVNLGGNVAVIGEKDEDTPWTIGVERPFTDRTELVGTIEVTDATVVTSGIYERNFESGGKVYHHILDPETGYPAVTDLDAVTITAKKGNSGFCDAVSTACLILGKDKAIQFIEKLRQMYPEKGLEAAFIDNNGDIVQTDGMNITFTE